MSYQKVTLEITGEVEVLYNEQSPEFQQALSVWNELICDGDAEDLVKAVVSQLRSWGDHERMIEGVGYVGLIGRPVPEKGYCGIQVAADYGQLIYEFD
jgi:hypothetical protein